MLNKIMFGSLLLSLLLGAPLSSSFNQAHAAPPAAELFGKLPDIHDAALSPDSSKIAFIMNKEGRTVLAVTNLEEKETSPKGIGLGEGVKPEYVKWVNDHRVMLSFWQSEKSDGVPYRTGYLYSLDTNSMKGRILVDPAKGGRPSTGSRLAKSGVFRQFNNIVVDWLEDDPDHILMSYSESDNNIKPDIRRVNVATGADAVVQRGMSNVQFWYTDLTGEPRIGQGRKDDLDDSWVMRIRDSKTGDWNSADDYTGLESDTDIHGFTSNPDELIISSYQGQDTIGLYVYDLSKKSITRKIYHNDTYDATGVILSHDGDKIIGAKFTGDTPQTEMLGDTVSIMQNIREQFNGFTVDHIDQSQDGKTILFKASSSYDPGAIMLYESSSKKFNKLKSLRPSLQPQELGGVISVSYSARDNQKIPSFVTLPSSITETSQIKNLPFIVLPHGGPYARDAKRFDYFAQFFATRGYGVLQMNFRGSEGYGKSFEQAGRDNWIVMQDDVEDGTKWLIEKGYADPDRICIAGWSYGGYAALMGAAKQPDLYTCAIAMAALTDIKNFVRDQKQYRFGRQTSRAFIGNGFKDKDDIKANSPVKIAEDMTVPLFLAHGKYDQQVDFNQFRRMKSALRKSDANVTYMEFEKEDHYLSNEENRKAFFKGLDKFLERNLGKSEFAK